MKASDQRREAARDPKGRFGVQPVAEADSIDLTTPRPADEPTVESLPADAFAARFAPSLWADSWDDLDQMADEYVEEPADEDEWEEMGAHFSWGGESGCTVDEIAESFASGEPMRRPVEVIYDDVSGTWGVTDGHHRVVAALRTGTEVRFVRLNDGPGAEPVPEGDPRPAFDWRPVPVVVEGRQFTYADVYGGRLFHGSIHDLPDGATLEPGKADANFSESADDAVSITSAANSAHYWATEAAGGHASARPRFVYEIEPLGPITGWRAMLANRGQSFRLQEGRVPAARIVRRIDLDDAHHYESALGRGEDPFPRSDP